MTSPQAPYPVYLEPEFAVIENEVTYGYKAWGIPASEFWPTPTPTPASKRFSSDDVIAAASGSRHPGTVGTIFRFEVGGVGYNPYAIHLDDRCVGPGGLCSYGLLSEFHRRGGSDPHNPFQVADYIDSVLDEPGRSCNWPYLCR